MTSSESGETTAFTNLRTPSTIECCSWPKW
ncbi:Uncharacterised protein [Vibrio cholerae]|nr:Uncharacterised protein [Vibrio cholerae]